MRLIKRKMDESVETADQLNQLTSQLAGDYAQYLNVDLSEQVTKLINFSNHSKLNFLFLSFLFQSHRLNRRNIWTGRLKTIWCIWRKFAANSTNCVHRTGWCWTTWCRSWNNACPPCCDCSKTSNSAKSSWPECLKWFRSTNDWWIRRKNSWVDRTPCNDCSVRSYARKATTLRRPLQPQHLLLRSQASAHLRSHTYLKLPTLTFRNTLKIHNHSIKADHIPQDKQTNK